MSRIKKTHTRKLAALAALAVLVPAAQAQAQDTANDTSQFSVTGGDLVFNLDPAVPNLPGLTLNGEPQTLNAAMLDWEVKDARGSGDGWNVNVKGDTGANKSPVFSEYCTDGTATNGCDTAVSGGAGPGYVTTSPKSLAANSLKLDSDAGQTAAFSPIGGTSGDAPTHTCNAGCNVDSATPVIIGSAAVNAGMGTWKANNYGATSLALSAPTTVKAIGTGNKVYRVDLLHTLASGPS